MAQRTTENLETGPGTTAVKIRWMIRRDMPEVLATEEDSSEFPWSEEEFLRCLRQRNCIGMVAEHDERVVGFMIYELNKTRIHVLNFAVARDHQRQGIGRQMVQKLTSKLSYQRKVHITIDVRKTNLSARLFFRAMKFVEFPDPEPSVTWMFETTSVDTLGYVSPNFYTPKPPEEVTLSYALNTEQRVRTALEEIGKTGELEED